MEKVNHITEKEKPKYWVPAIEKAHLVMNLVCSSPRKYRLMDLVHETGINKSSMFSLLQTMEALNWIVLEPDGTYSNGSVIAQWAASFYRHNDLISEFRKEASLYAEELGETIQLARLEHTDVVYLAKEECSYSRVRLVSEPGMTYPAHITALGKVMLAGLTDKEVRLRYAGQALEQPTPNSVKDSGELFKQLDAIRKQGCAFDLQEAVIGFCCVAAPITNSSGEVVAAVSCSMLQQVWEEKKDRAALQIKTLARKLTQAAQQ